MWCFRPEAAADGRQLLPMNAEQAADCLIRRFFPEQDGKNEAVGLNRTAYGHKLVQLPKQERCLKIPCRLPHRTNPKTLKNTSKLACQALALVTSTKHKH
jgi:hypothetical protein